MAHFHAVSMNQDEHSLTFPTWNEINDALKHEGSDVKRRELIERIRNTTPPDESGAGLKKWLELNNYNLDKASIWIQKIEGEYTSVRLKKSNQSLIRYLTATFLLVFGSIYSYLRLVKEDAWEDYYMHDPGLLIPENTASVHVHWMLEYKNGRTSNAYAILKGLKKSFPTNDTLNFYEAVMEFEQGKVSSAMNVLSARTISENSIFRDRAEFLEALCLWRLKRVKDSKNALIHIANDANQLFSSKAKLILSEEFS